MRAVSRSAFHRPLQTAIGHQPVDETGGERIAAADAIEDLEVRPGRRLEELAVRPGDRRPVIHRRRLRMTQRRRNHFQMWELAYDLQNHRLELIGVELRILARFAFHGKAERR